MAPGTREAYGFCINRYERFFGRPADALGRQEVETFLLHLVRERKLSPGAHNVYAAALRFVYGAALGRPEVTQGIPRRKKPMRLPVLLSPEQVASLLGAVASLTVRTVLMLAYGGGLRVGEACRLRVHAQVHALLEQLRGEAVTQGVGGHPVVDAHPPRRLAQPARHHLAWRMRRTIVRLSMSCAPCSSCSVTGGRTAAILGQRVSDVDPSPAVPGHRARQIPSPRRAVR
jgi:hypothetical protein